MTVHEPATFATDLLLAFLGFGLAWHLKRGTIERNYPRLAWAFALNLMALSALAGGIYHGFAPNFTEYVDATWWRIVLVMMCCMSFAMDLSLIHEISHRPRTWQRIAGIKASLFIVAAVATPDFRVAIIAYGSAMIAWTVAAVVLRRDWSGWMLGGVILSFLSACVQQSGIRPSEHFNHNDLYHVIQTFSIFSFYRAGRSLGFTHR